ncbi:MAG: hypothetical protein WC214_05660 [Candidatus Omnitrophota bacterium]|jgi:hypothetical protein
MSAKEKVDSLRCLKKESLERYNERLGPNKKSKYHKTEFTFSDKPACHNLHNIIYFCHHSDLCGYVSSVFSDSLTPYIAKAIDEMKESIFHHALRLIDRDINKQIGDLKAEREGLDNLIKELANKEGQ